MQKKEIARLRKLVANNVLKSQPSNDSLINAKTTEQLYSLYAHKSESPISDSGFDVSQSDGGQGTSFVIELLY